MLADVAFSLNLGRKPLPVRQAFVCRTHDEALAALADPVPPPVRLDPGVSHSVVFLFRVRGKPTPISGTNFTGKKIASVRKSIVAVTLWFP